MGWSAPNLRVTWQSPPRVSCSVAHRNFQRSSAISKDVLQFLRMCCDFLGCWCRSLLVCAPGLWEFKDSCSSAPSSHCSIRVTRSCDVGKQTQHRVADLVALKREQMSTHECSTRMRNYSHSILSPWVTWICAPLYPVSRELQEKQHSKLEKVTSNGSSPISWWLVLNSQHYEDRPEEGGWVVEFGRLRSTLTLFKRQRCKFCYPV